jgi:hypothetical protein
MKINVVVSAPEMAVSIHFMDANSLFSSEAFLRLYVIASHLSVRLDKSTCLAQSTLVLTGRSYPGLCH